MIQFVLFSFAFAYLFHRLTLSKSVITQVSEFYFNRVKYRNSLTQADYRKINTYLEENIPFYQKLSIEGKAKFITRCLRFINTCEWDFRGNLQPSRKAQFLVASSAIQITFGFDRDFLYPNLQRIILFPSSFYNGMLKRNLKGGSTKTSVMLSWEHTLEGYADPTDNLNLALHEFAHSLKLNAKEGSINHFFTVYIDKWLSISQSEKLRLQQKEESFLRQYGGTNDHEFFAVAVEHFFESPEQFKTELPTIYYHLCVLLNLNLLSPSTDYQLTTAAIREINANKMLLPIPKVSRIKQALPNLYYTNLMAAGFIIIGVLIFRFPTLLISNQSITLLIIVAIIFGGFAAKKSLVDTKVMSWSVYPLFLLLGYTPLHILVYLLLNSSFLLEEKSANYQVIDIHYNNQEYHVVTANQMVNKSNAVKYKILPSDVSKIKRKDLVLKVHYAQGWLGANVITNSVLLAPSASLQ